MRTQLKRKTSPRRATVPPEYEQLLTLRLERDWSWAYLEAQMLLAGCRLSRYTLIDMRSRAGKHPRGPYDRTLYKIRKFLRLQRSHHRRKTDPARLQTFTG